MISPITFDQLTGPPTDLELLDLLEFQLTKSAELFIAEVVKKGFSIDSLVFECTYSPILARAKITNKSSYKITFGRTLTGAILHMATSIAPGLKKDMKGCSEPETIRHAFNYISWLIFLHEVAHITHGHLEYIQSNGSNDYYEVNNQRLPLTHLHIDLEESKRFWRALESEADAYAISASLATFSYINTNVWWNQLKLGAMTRHHGAMASAAFHLMHMLANGHDDFRHPPANIRLGISLASIETLAKKMKWDVATTVEETVKGHYFMTSDIMGLDVDIKPQLESAHYMLTLDYVIKRAGFAKFRIPTYLD
ncbi:hypothetical protein [Pseudomonas helleri]|uniref:hypothetical protein n=1 Tax=Pseudomonas helleri TaxID=1608996 RepID=UPI003FD5FEC0